MKYSKQSPSYFPHISFLYRCPVQEVVAPDRPAPTKAAQCPTAIHPNHPPWVGAALHSMVVNRDSMEPSSNSMEAAVVVVVVMEGSMDSISGIKELGMNTVHELLKVEYRHYMSD